MNDNEPKPFPPDVTEMRLVKDGDAWMFVLPEFKNLQESRSIWWRADSSSFDEIYEELTRVDERWAK